MRPTYYVYILASTSGTLYVGVTNSLGGRWEQHLAGIGSEFTRKYGVNRLIYCEAFKYIGNAIAREKQIKGWSRKKKIALIESGNPSWRDLSRDFGKEFKPVTPDRASGERGSSPAKSAGSE